MGASAAGRHDHRDVENLGIPPRDIYGKSDQTRLKIRGACVPIPSTPVAFCNSSRPRSDDDVMRMMMRDARCASSCAQRAGTAGDLASGLSVADASVCGDGRCLLIKNALLKIIHISVYCTDKDC